jgi:hypothetical protein
MLDHREQKNKKPEEQFGHDFKFFQRMPPGASSIDSANVSAKKWPRKEPTIISDATSEILGSTDGEVLEPHNRTVRIQVVGGTDGYNYQITVSVIFDNGAVLDDDLFVWVREE